MIKIKKFNKVRVSFSHKLPKKVRKEEELSLWKIFKISNLFLNKKKKDLIFHLEV